MKYTTLLPFMDSEDLKDLADKIISGEVKNVKIVTLYPFLNRETMNAIIDFLIKEKRYKDLYSALPFISKDKINELYEASKNGELEGFKSSALIPFLGKSKIKEIFNTLVSEAAFDDDEDDEDDFDDDDNDDDEDDDDEDDEAPAKPKKPIDL